FKNELRAFVDQTLSRSYTRDDGKAPRLVLATPIAMEQHPQFFLPDAKERNSILKAYAEVIGEVAGEKRIGVLDLFTPTQTWFADSEQPLTINGVHLSADGYKQLAPVIMQGLFGKGVEAADDKSLIRQAIADKAWFWRNDYRMLNGVHAYGRRWAPYGNFNYPQEIEKIRQMTVLRDRNVWAIAQGKSTTLKVDDSVTRPLSPVETNYQVSEKNGTTDFLITEEQAKEKFTLPEGYEVSLFASEQQFPNLGNPCQMRFDNRGRLWVSTLPSYPHYKPGDAKPNDMLLIYEDTDGDGRADKETVFAQGLHMPIGFELAPEGVYLSQEPFLMLLKDTDGDDQADQTEYLLDGFDPHDTHHAISAFDMDHGSGIYMCEGRFLHSQVETPWGPQRMTDGGVWRFDPNSWKVERVMQTDVSNPWGVEHDEFGQTFVNDASGGAQYWMLGYSLKIPHASEVPKVAKFNYEHHARPTSGIEFLVSSHFPDEVQGDYLYTNSIGFLGIKQLQTLEDGAELKGKFRQDLIQSTDGNFRPCDLELAPDGSLYFLDWHNTLIGHMQHSARDPLRNSEYGRIYRITYPSRPLVDPPEIAGASIDELFENTKLTEINARKRSHRELRGRDKAEVMAAAHKFADQNSGDERLVLEALWATWGQQAPSTDLINRCMSAKDHRVRAAAVRVVRHSLHLLDDPESYLTKAATDEHQRVRLEALAAASWLGGQPGAEVLLTVATQKTDKWTRNALNSAMLLLKPEVEALLSKQKFSPDDLSIDHEKLLSSKLQGAAKPKNYRTKSAKFKDKNFARAYSLGERVFYEEGSCYTCHRDHGEGIVRIYPPLVDSEWVTGDQDRLIKLTLHGIWGKIRVRGEMFETTQGVPPMTAIGNFFTDAEIAAALTYVRNSWGNDADIVLPEDVKRVRGETKGRLKFYSPEELIEMHPFPEGSRPALIADTMNTELEKSLLAESLADLAKAALKDGDAARGAKLFYGKKTACGNCHDVQEGYQMGPQLTVSRKQTTPEFLIESILKPSESILKGFQSVNVLTVDGVSLSGYLVEETEDEITISIATDGGKPRKIAQDDVEAIKELSQSTMPAGLANLCGNRQGFLDLVKFVFEINRDGNKRLRQLKRQAKVE
ncbi:MAG: PVC-type heme-binding CxxCH protein, partial [Rubripirellula sp.]